jgi:hypothetical protein
VFIFYLLVHSNLQIIDLNINLLFLIQCVLLGAMEQYSLRIFYMVLKWQPWLESAEGPTMLDTQGGSSL